MQRKFTVISLVLVVVLLLGAIGFVSAQEGDTLTILYWQAASILNPHLAVGTKDYDAGGIVVEPLAHFTPDGELVPTLVDEVPTVENGGVAADFTSITWTLKEGLLWSDGTPVTTDDLIFTWEYCTNEETGCTNLSSFDGVESIEAVDDRTITIRFSAPTPYPYGPFVTSISPVLQKAQFADCVGAAAANCTEQNFAPIGTGSYMVESFAPNDVVTYVPNPNYRDGAPYFSRVIFKGGGDAESAARAVLETGEADYAWNLQVPAAILDQMEAAGVGTIGISAAGNVERILLNQTNPDPALGDMRSLWVEDGSNAHPFLTHPAVYKAMSMSIDRNVMATQLYGRGGTATCNILAGPAAFVSPNNDSCLTPDIEGAKALLDDAGIVDTDNDGVRELDGVPLVVLFQTSTNTLRQGEQALVKQAWEEIGMSVELRNIDAAVYFGGDPSSPDTIGKFFADVEMFTNGPSGSDVQTYLHGWTCGEIAHPDNGWNGNNQTRYCSEEYDALYDELTVTTDPQKRIELAIALNDNLVQNGVVIPLILRGSVSAYSNTIEGVWVNGGWDTEMWNIAEWKRSS